MSSSPASVSGAVVAKFGEMSIDSDSTLLLPRYLPVLLPLLLLLLLLLMPLLLLLLQLLLRYYSTAADD